MFLRQQSEKGSALLIVLGFLSFMVISAISFSIYMRNERAPSSSLRQGVATRFLVKAALAQAMSRVDDAVRNDPFPGVVNSRKNFYKTRRGAEYDCWVGRVFMPPNNPEEDDGYETESGSYPGFNPGREYVQTRLAPIDQTVSVLTLEALGYLPPDLVNDVRFLSRSSWAAKWDYFNFDAGRFAYCAVNVSDYFDIGRVKACSARNSSPGGRISIAHLFPAVGNNNDPAIDVNAAAEFDRFTKTDVRVPTDNQGDTGYKLTVTTPYVSMLDYNLAMKSKGQPNYETGVSGYSIPQIYSPFLWWVTRGTGSGFFYKGSILPSSEGIAPARRQTFITGSLSAQSVAQEYDGAVSERTTSKLNLNDSKFQPFEPAVLNMDNVTIGDVYQNAMRLKGNAGNNSVDCFWDKAVLQFLHPEHGGMVNIFTLFDYLDRNDVPLSLAMPCVERVPSIAALKVQPELMLKLKGDDVPSKSEEGDYIVTRKNYKLQGGANSLNLGSIVDFPFTSGLSDEFFDAGNYKMDYVVKAFFAPKGLVKTRVNDAFGFKPKTNNNFWNESEQKKNFQNGGLVFSTMLKDQNVDIEKERTINIPFNVDQGQVIVQEITRQKGKRTDAGLVPDESQEPVITYKFETKPLLFDNGGLSVENRFNDEISKEDLQQMETEYKMYYAVWARIRNKNNKTVDLVPASLRDDLEQNGIDNDGDVRAKIIFGGDASGVDSDLVPMLVFESSGNNNDGVKLSDWVMNETEFISGKCVFPSFYTVDARFNHAPENWVARNTDTFTMDDWLANGPMLGGAYDSDSYKTVSNQGYLQSLAELSFLPRVTSSDANIEEIMKKNYDGVLRNARESVANSAFVCRSYGMDEIYIGVADNETPPENAINPYTDNDTIFKSAIMYSPYDYWAAGTNYNKGVTCVDAAFKQENNFSSNIKYTFSKEGNDHLQLGYNNINSNLTCVSTLMREYIRNQYTEHGKIWEESYDEFCHAMMNVPKKPRVAFDETQAVTINNYESRGDRFNHDNLQSLLAGNQAVQQDSEKQNAIQRAQELGDQLTEVDRKFLYSYWRNCFAVDQQLFLIFVRAESNALGGTGEGTPAQQGGRAVALVWRDPYPVEGSSDDQILRQVEDGGNPAVDYKVDRQPHRMRILFYHQFE